MQIRSSLQLSRTIPSRLTVLAAAASCRHEPSSRAHVVPMKGQCPAPIFFGTIEFSRHVRENSSPAGYTSCAPCQSDPSTGDHSEVLRPAIRDLRCASNAPRRPGPTTARRERRRRSVSAPVDLVMAKSSRATSSPHGRSSRSPPAHPALPTRTGYSSARACRRENTPRTPCSARHSPPSRG